MSDPETAPYEALLARFVALSHDVRQATGRDLGEPSTVAMMRRWVSGEEPINFPMCVGLPGEPATDWETLRREREERRLARLARYRP